MTATALRHDWTLQEARSLYELPFNDLLFRAQSVHRQNFDPNEVQVSTLLSIKTGACPEDCKYCPQSGHYNTGLEKEKLLELEQVVGEDRAARDKRASRFCMGAAWRSPTVKDMPYVLDMVREVKSLGLETCMTLGMLKPEQAAELAEAGLDYYNHNLDTSEKYYSHIITTRTYQDRLDTLENVRNAGMKVCCGGIMGMGEDEDDRVGMLVQLANLPQHPESVPVNMLVKVKGTPMENVEDLDPFEFIRVLAVARIMMPASHVRLSAGRETMNEQMQALCFLAGANWISYAESCWTISIREAEEELRWFGRWGIRPEKREQCASETQDEEAIVGALEYEASRHLFYDASLESA